MEIGIQQVSEIAGVSQLTVRDYCAKRKIPHYKVGGKLVFKEDEILQWQASRTVRRAVRND